MDTFVASEHCPPFNSGQDRRPSCALFAGLGLPLGEVPFLRACCMIGQTYTPGIYWRGAQGLEAQVLWPVSPVPEAGLLPAHAIPTAAEAAAEPAEADESEEEQVRAEPP